MAEPQQLSTKAIPERSTLPMVPSLVIPTCGPWMVRQYPLSGTWALMAPQPVLPANGKPDSPPRLKLVPYTSMKSSSSCRASSSAQTEVARRVLLGVKPFNSSKPTTRETSSLLAMAPGKLVLTSLSKAVSTMGGEDVSMKS